MKADHVKMHAFGVDPVAAQRAGDSAARVGGRLLSEGIDFGMVSALGMMLWLSKFLSRPPRPATMTTFSAIEIGFRLDRLP
jgi:hypothetical protein